MRLIFADGIVPAEDLFFISPQPKEEKVGHPLFEQLLSLPEEFPGISALPADVAYLLGCGSQGQFESTLKAIVEPARFCPFCAHYWPNRDVLCETPEIPMPRWAAIKNAFKGNGKDGDNTVWYLLVPARHVTSFEDLVLADGMSIMYLTQQVNERLGLKGGALVARYDHPAHHVGTVPHFHINLMSPDGDTELRAALGKTHDQHAKNWPRLRSFVEQVTANGGFDTLFAA